jgi:glutathione S-transferase
LSPESQPVLHQELPLKIYYHPISTTSRMLMLFAEDSAIKVDFQVVDLFTGEHAKPPYTAMNPNGLVPMLEEGDFRLTESSAILKYMAEKTGSPTYPADLRKRAKINEMMDWFNTQLYREYAYGLIYPQVFPNLRRPTDDQQAGTIAWGKDKARAWLKILDENLIGPKNAYLCGNEISIADFFGAPILTAGELIRCDLTPYKNISRWLANMKARPSWPKVNKAFNDLTGSLKETQFETL